VEFYLWIFPETICCRRNFSLPKLCLLNVNICCMHVGIGFCLRCVYVAFCVAGVFTVIRKKGAVCMFKNVANPHLYLAIGPDRSLCATVGASTMNCSLSLTCCSFQSILARQCNHVYPWRPSVCLSVCNVGELWLYRPSSTWKVEIGTPWRMSWRPAYRNWSGS